MSRHVRPEVHLRRAARARALLPASIAHGGRPGAEQDYYREKMRRHNRYLHGWGVVCGCSVEAVAVQRRLAGARLPRLCRGPHRRRNLHRRPCRRRSASGRADQPCTVRLSSRRWRPCRPPTTGRPPTSRCVTRSAMRVRCACTPPVAAATKRAASTRGCARRSRSRCCGSFPSRTATPRRTTLEWCGAR